MEVYNPRSRSVICNYCRSQIDHIENEAEQKLKSHRNKMPVCPGWEGKYGNEDVRILNRIRYAFDGEKWDEFLMLTEGGRHLLLHLRDGVPILYEEFTPPEAYRVDQLFNHNEADITINTEKREIIQKGSGRVIQMDGEIHHGFRKNDFLFFMIMGDYYIQWYDGEIRYFIKKSSDWSNIRDIFGRLNDLSYICHEDQNDFRCSQGCRGVSFYLFTFILLILVLSAVLLF